MNSRNVGTLVVVDHSGHPTGMVTDRDLVTKVLALGRDPVTTAVGDVMSSKIKTVHESTPIEHALSLMRNSRIRRLPVVDEAGVLIGLLSLDDVLELLAEEFKSIGGILQRARPRALTIE
jgi:CBS domain-containing protein